MRVLLLACAVALAAACAKAPPPQPWTYVGPSRVLEILNRHRCPACHSVEAVFGAASQEDAEPPPERACTRTRVEGDGEAFCHVPTLASMHRFRARWLRSFLAAPADLRPGLTEAMIRHDLSPAEVDALVVGWGAAVDEAPEPTPPPTSLARGAALYEQKQCGACHQFGGRPVALSATPAPTPRQLALAPDLKHTRLRLPRATVERFLLLPASVRPTTEMPRTPLSAEEARALADFIAFAPVDAADGGTGAPPDS